MSARRVGRSSGEDCDLLAATVLIVTGVLAGAGGVTAAATGQVHGGRAVGAVQVLYGVVLLWSAWQVIWRLRWSSFLIGAPLLLASGPLDGLLYDRPGHWWPSIMAVLVVIEWGRRLIWPFGRAVRADHGTGEIAHD